eukprot:s2318_g2.t1
MAACAAARPKRLKESERILRQMVRCNIVPNAATLDILVWAVGQARGNQLCEELGLPAPRRKAQTVG